MPFRAAGGRPAAPAEGGATMPFRAAGGRPAAPAEGGTSGYLPPPLVRVSTLAECQRSY